MAGKTWIDLAFRTTDLLEAANTGESPEEKYVDFEVDVLAAVMIFEMGSARQLKVTKRQQHLLSSSSTKETAEAKAGKARGTAIQIMKSLGYFGDEVDEKAPAAAAPFLKQMVREYYDVSTVVDSHPSLKKAYSTLIAPGVIMQFGMLTLPFDPSIVDSEFVTEERIADGISYWTYVSNTCCSFCPEWLFNMQRRSPQLTML